MRSEVALFFGDFERRELRFDVGSETGELRSCGDANEENARAALVREKSEIAEGHGNRGAMQHAREMLFDWREVFVFCPANEFQRDVNAFRTHPFGPARKGL